MPDPAKVKAILSMKKPDDVAAVQRLMGMVKYLSKFLSDLYVLWFWTKEQDVAFDKIKEAVTSAPVLKYFDSSEMLLHKNLVLCSHRKTTLSLMEAGL